MGTYLMYNIIYTYIGNNNISKHQIKKLITYLDDLLPYFFHISYGDINIYYIIDIILYAICFILHTQFELLSELLIERVFVFTKSIQ